MIIFPAIDIRGGKCVRLLKGDFEKETVFSDKPEEMAKKWQAQGAEFLHLVDLDGALAGKSQNLATVEKILAAVDIPVELGGGIRTMENIDDVLALGVRRAILGSVAVCNPELVREACAKYGDRIVVGIDAKDGIVAVDGWGVSGDVEATALAKEMKKAGVRTIIYTGYLARRHAFGRQCRSDGQARPREWRRHRRFGRRQVHRRHRGAEAL